MFLGTESPFLGEKFPESLFLGKVILGTKKRFPESVYECDFAKVISGTEILFPNSLFPNSLFPNSLFPNPHF